MALAIRGRLCRLRVRRLPEGVYLATSRDVPGMVVQAKTMPHLMEYATDVAQQLEVARAEADT